MKTFYKECELIMVQSNNISPIIKIGDWNRLVENFVNELYPVDSDEKFQHLYIVSDEDIKDGDWVLTKDDSFKKYCKNGSYYGKILKVAKHTIANQIYLHTENNLDYYTVPKKDCKKIIACTDNLQVADYDNQHLDYNPSKYLPQITQSFIQHYINEYNKGNKLKKVMVEYEEELINPNQKYDSLVINSDNTINISIIEDFIKSENEKQQAELFDDLLFNHLLKRHSWKDIESHIYQEALRRNIILK